METRLDQEIPKSWITEPRPRLCHRESARDSRRRTPHPPGWHGAFRPLAKPRGMGFSVSLGAPPADPGGPGLSHVLRSRDPLSTSSSSQA